MAMLCHWTLIDIEINFCPFGTFALALSQIGPLNSHNFGTIGPITLKLVLKSSLIQYLSKCKAKLDYKYISKPQYHHKQHFGVLLVAKLALCLYSSCKYNNGFKDTNKHW